MTNRLRLAIEATLRASVSVATSAVLESFDQMEKVLMEFRGMLRDLDGAETEPPSDRWVPAAVAVPRELEAPYDGLKDEFLRLLRAGDGVVTVEALRAVEMAIPVARAAVWANSK